MLYFSKLRILSIALFSSLFILIALTNLFKIDDDFFDKKEQTVNQKLCDVRSAFEKYNLISGLHTFYSKNDLIYKNVLPPLSILNSNEEKELIDNLEKLNFSTKPIMAA